MFHSLLGNEMIINNMRVRIKAKWEWAALKPAKSLDPLTIMKSKILVHISA